MYLYNKIKKKCYWENHKEEKVHLNTVLYKYYKLKIFLIICLFLWLHQLLVGAWGIFSWDMQNLRACGM